MSQSKFRFSIRAILIATGYTALAVAALVNPTKAWLGVMYGITIAMLFFSLLGIIYRTERTRAYWTGFALFGFGYMGLIFGPFAEISAKLPTTLVLEYALYKFHGPSMNQYGAPWMSYPSSTTTYSSPVTTYPSPAYIPSPVTSAPTASYSPNSSSVSTAPSGPAYAELPSTDPAPAVSSTSPVGISPATDAPSEPPADDDEESTSGPATLTPISSTSSTPPPFTAAPTYYAPSYNGSSYTVPLISYSMNAIYYFTAIGQAEFAMLFAAMGGLAAQFLFASRALKEASAANS